MPVKRVDPATINLTVEKAVWINRVAKVTKGAKRFNFAALVIVGDEQGPGGAGGAWVRAVARTAAAAAKAPRRARASPRGRDSRGDRPHSASGSRSAGACGPAARCTRVERHACATRPS